MLISLALLTLLGQAQGPVPFTVEPSPDGLRFMTQVNGEPQELSAIHAGPTRDILRHGSAVYVAPVAGGLVVIDAQDPVKPVVTSHLAEGRVIVQFGHSGATTLLGMLEDHSALSFDTTDPLHPIPAEYTQPAPATPGGAAAPTRSIASRTPCSSFTSKLTASKPNVVRYSSTVRSSSRQAMPT